MLKADWTKKLIVDCSVPLDTVDNFDSSMDHEKLGNLKRYLKKLKIKR